MSKKEILDWFTVNSESLSVDKVLFVLCISLLVGVVIFITYRLAYTGVSYNSRFNAGNVVIVLITSVIMLMISSAGTLIPASDQLMPSPVRSGITLKGSSAKPKKELNKNLAISLILGHSCLFFQLEQLPVPLSFLM